MTDAAPLPSKTWLGNYELLRVLGQGGMADIYLARHCELGDLVALKVINARRGTEPEACALFLDEARLAAMLDHDNLARAYEIHTEGGLLYYAMEYIDGVDLRELFWRATTARREIPFDCAVSIVAAAAAGLDHAHRRCTPDGRPLHLVHRDVSLSNIMVGSDGVVKVIDFGIASSSAATHATNPGTIRGKASYMAPEQCLGGTIDLRTDVFALGVVLYELSTGKRCFAGETDFERMLAIVRGNWVAPSVLVAGFPKCLERIIRTALALDPRERYPSAAAMIEDLEAAAAAQGWTLGTDAIARALHDLCGLKPSEPDDDDAETREIRPHVAPQDAAPARTMEPARPLARGTDAAGLTHAQPSEWRDEVPTRGRRLGRRPPSINALAA